MCCQVLLEYRIKSMKKVLVVAVCLLVSLLSLIDNGVAQIFNKANRISSSPVISGRIDDATLGATGGLVGEFYQSNPPGRGYNRFVFEYSTANRLPAAADINVEVRLGFECEQRLPPSTVGTFVIAQGKNSGQTEIVVPLANYVHTMHVDTLVNGRAMAGLGFSTGTEAFVNDSTMLFIGSEKDYQEIEQVDFAYFLQPFNTLNNGNLKGWSLPVTISLKGSEFESKRSLYNNSYNSNSALDSVSQRFTTADKCPYSLLDWTTVRSVNISIDTLLESEPKFQEFLLQYVQAGGGLCVVTNLDRTFAEKKLNDLVYMRIRNNGLSDWGHVATRAEEIVSYLGLGAVAIRKVDGLKDGFTQINSEANDWFSKNSDGEFEPRIEKFTSTSFWDWSLRSLGKPPIVLFCIFIAVLVGIIAPLILIFCVRTGRGALLLFLLPLVATLATLMLIVIAVFRDGFTTHLRVRSISLIDQDATQGVTLSRQTLFAGTTPRSGLQFNNDSEVWQLESDNSYSSNAKTGGQLRWTDDEQIYTGLIKPREQFQFIVNQPLSNFRPFEWIKRPSSAAAETEMLDTQRTCEIRNTTKNKIKLMVVASTKGQHYLGEDINVNDVGILSPVSIQQAVIAISKTDSTQPLEPPEGLYSNNSQSIASGIFGNSRNTSNYYSPRGKYYELFKDMNDSLLDGQNLTNVARYLMFLNDADFVDFALPNLKVENSLHVIAGNWDETAKVAQ